MLNSLIVISVLIIAIISYYAFILPSREKKLFELYEIRDNDSLKASHGRREEDGKR